MKKTLIALLFLASLGTSLTAKTIDPSTARRVGTNFYFQRINLHANVPYEQLKIAESFTEKYSGSLIPGISALIRTDGLKG